MGIVFSFALGVWLFDQGLTLSSAAGIVLIIGAGVAATLPRGPRKGAAGAPTES